MPELPEVEVLRMSLEPRLLDRTVKGLEIRSPSLREPIPKRQLRGRALGRRIIGLRRRAKYLLVDLEGGSTLVFHLGMSGRLTLASGSTPPEPHEHLALCLSSGDRLRFRDPRRFGLALVLPSAELESDRHFRHLGIEPLSPCFSGEILRALAAGRRAPVKSFLMDARIVVGLGNIYATEALFRAGVHPRRSVARLSRLRWQQLADAIVSVLQQAIGEGGTTLNDFTDGAGNDGYFQVSLAVYGREGEPCRRCARSIRRILQSGRSSFYCPGCQR